MSRSRPPVRSAAMAEFLSPEWMEELDDAARASATLAAIEGPLVVEQRVTGTTHGDRCYHLLLGDGPARVVPGAASSPDLVLSTDYDTARAIHEGVENAQRALSAGRLRVHGNLDAVLDRVDALSVLDDVFADVRSRTGLPDET